VNLKLLSSRRDLEGAMGTDLSKGYPHGISEENHSAWEIPSSQGKDETRERWLRKQPLTSLCSPANRMSTQGSRLGSPARKTPDELHAVSQSSCSTSPARKMIEETQRPKEQPIKLGEGKGKKFDDTRKGRFGWQGEGKNTDVDKHSRVSKGGGIKMEQPTAQGASSRAPNLAEKEGFSQQLSPHVGELKAPDEKKEQNSTASGLAGLQEILNKEADDSRDKGAALKAREGTTEGVTINTQVSEDQDGDMTIHLH
jgi:hypothetical protein